VISLDSVTRRHRPGQAAFEESSSTGARRSERDLHYSCVRRSGLRRLGCLHGSRAGCEVVGSAWIYAHDAQQGPASRRHLELHDAQTRRSRLPQHHALSRGRRAQKARIRPRKLCEDRPPLFRVTVLFSESNGKSTMEMSMALATVEQAEATRRFIKDAGGNATWDRLVRQARGAADQFLTNLARRAAGFAAHRPPVASVFGTLPTWARVGTNCAP